MAQTTRSRRSSQRSSSRTSTSRNGSSRTASGRARRKGSNSARATGSRRSTGTRARSRPAPSNGPIGKTSEKVAELASKAKAPSVPPTVRKTGSKVSTFASKAKTPLVAGGAALAGIAGGVALKSRTESKGSLRKGPLKKLRGVSLPRPMRKSNLRKIDFDTLTAAAHQVRAIGEQVGEVADAAERSRKKHK
jgi:hypothetical protein